MTKIILNLIERKPQNKIYNIIGKEKMTVRKIINLISKKTFAKKTLS